MTDSPDVAAAKRLLDAARDSGFQFQRIAPGEDGPLRGVRKTIEWLDEIYLAGFSGGCSAVRRRRSSLVVPGRAAGGAAGGRGRADGPAHELVPAIDSRSDSSPA